MTVCAIEGCDRPIHCKNMCGAHYMRWKRTGTTGTKPLGQASSPGDTRIRAGASRRPDSLLKRIYWRTRIVGDCWVYNGPRSAIREEFKDGSRYMEIDYGGKRHQRVHRLAYTQFVGPIPDGHDIHHTCGTKACWRPDHLTPMTPANHSALHAAAWKGTTRGSRAG